MVCSVSQSVVVVQKISLFCPHHTLDILLLSEYEMSSSYVKVTARYSEAFHLASAFRFWRVSSAPADQASTHSWALNHLIVYNSSFPALRCRSSTRESERRASIMNIKSTYWTYDWYEAELSRNLCFTYRPSVELFQWITSMTAVWNFAIQMLAYKRHSTFLRQMATSYTLLVLWSSLAY